MFEDIWAGGETWEDLLWVPMVDFGFAFLMIVGLRALAGLIGNVSSFEELAVRDNFAFGISLAGSAGALAMMLNASLKGEAAPNLGTEFGMMVGYGVTGLVLLTVGRLMQDKFVFRVLDIRAEIMKGNISAAIIDVANVVSTSLIIWSSMSWVETDGFEGLLSVLAGWAIAQLILAVVSIARMVTYTNVAEEGLVKRQGSELADSDIELEEVKEDGDKEDGDKGDKDAEERKPVVTRQPTMTGLAFEKDYYASLQHHLGTDNRALALRYMGHMIGAGLACMCGSQMVLYNADKLGECLLLWSLCSSFCIVLVASFAWLARKIILHGINLTEEVNEQRNIGVGAVEMCIEVVVGMLLQGVTSQPIVPCPACPACPTLMPPIEP
jgi:uncharacterized membrane protein YjfL (UPF0719 family)